MVPRASSLLTVLLLLIRVAAAAPVPEDFPRFLVPGHEQDMETLRELFWLHYVPARPLSTLWDGWLPMASLWPATEANVADQANRQRWRAALLARKIDAEGYVSTHQHRGLAHNDGWPFPLWSQVGGRGWHFSLAGQPYGPQFNIHQTGNTDGWEFHGAADRGIDPAQGWNLELTAADASITTPEFNANSYVAPFIRIGWQAAGLSVSDQPSLEWTTAEQPEFSRERRVFFSPPTEADGMTFTHVPLYRHPQWQGTLTRLRLNFGNAKPGAKLTLKSFITAVDSRHNINNSFFIQGSSDYFRWSGDIGFLRENIQRMRMALRYAMNEFRTRENLCVTTPWVGHDGTSGLVIGTDGKKTVRHGRGIGNNYWDLLPFGGKDCLATIYYFDAVRRMAELERQIAAHPQWNIPGGPLPFDAEDLAGHAQEVKDHAGRLFWNATTGRFVAAVDGEGAVHDYGFTFVNCEAIYYDFATEEQARSILDWLCGRRTIAGDTSQGEDIYHWRFGPRSTTLRNVEYYTSVWSNPESIPWGGQVQDGGAVLGFSYHDLMARLKTTGADDAWQRLKAVLAWFREVQHAGGYRAYSSAVDSAAVVP